MTVMFLTRPLLMYSATASAVLPANVLGRTDSSTGELSSLPILKNRPMLSRQVVFLPLPPPWPRCGLCLRPMAATSALRKDILVVAIRYPVLVGRPSHAGGWSYTGKAMLLCHWEALLFKMIGMDSCRRLNASGSDLLVNNRYEA